MDLPKEVLIYRVVPHFFLEIIKKYLRLDVEGMEHIPKDGAALLVPNHSGYSGFDAILLGFEINKATKRTPRVLTHHLWFINKNVNIPANKLGFVEANKENGVGGLEKGELVTLFPEGEHGNFKPTSDRYQLQPFKRGFVRMALETGAPIIPVIIIGAEETHINLAKLKFTKFLRGVILPLPMNVLPLPAKWKIKILEPIHLPYKKGAENDTELVHEIASEIREKMQLALSQELKNRDYVFIDGIY